MGWRYVAKRARGSMAALSWLFPVVVGCQGPSGSTPPVASKPPAPAKVEGAVKEADLATVTLSPEAETRLGLATAPIEQRAVPRVVIYAGEVMIPHGRLTAVTAPFVGTVKAPPGQATLPLPGQSVDQGQVVCVLVPVLSPESRATLAPLRIEADGQVKQAREQLHIAQVNLDRAENLVRDKLGGSAALVDAKAQYDLASTNLKAAEARQAMLEKVASEAEGGTMSLQTVNAPASGIVLNVHAQPGQVVAAGAALFEVADLDPLWVKVPVYVGDLPRLARKEPAEIGGLAASVESSGARQGKPVVAPPSGDHLAATVHLYYEIANADGALHPGERVGVTLRLQGGNDCLAAPRASLMRDIHGGTWVYEKTGDHKYTRRRVLVDRVVGETAVLAAGPKAGTSVVTDGAAELYGTEFGGGK